MSDIVEINTDDHETFKVWQFLVDDIQECVREGVSAADAVSAAYHYTHNIAAMAGITQRVIVVDSGDCIVFEWLAGKGVVFPTSAMRQETRREYSK